MLGEIFYWIFNMSIAAAICGLPVLLLRCIKRIPRRFLPALWLIPFIRMCVPFGITAKYSLMSFLARFTGRSVTVHEFSTDLAVTYMNHIGAADGYFPLTYKVNFLNNLFSVASFIWLAVGLSLVFAYLIVYTITMQELRDPRPFGERVYLSDKIKTPAVYGIIKPRIVLPHVYPENELHFILLHERTHISRGDNFFRALALLIVCFHWFNPLAWLFLKLLYSDIELACDESVIAKCTASEKTEYARTLIKAAEGTNVFAAAFGGAKIRLRIESILSYRKLSVLSAVSFAAFILSVAYALLTNAV